MNKYGPITPNHHLILDNIPQVCYTHIVETDQLTYPTTNPSATHIFTEETTMPKITITIEGDTDELKDTLARLFALQNGSAHATISPQPSDYTSDDHWTPAIIERFWRRIKPNARLVLVESARNPEGIPPEELRQHLNIALKSMGGINSSIGFAVNYFRKHLDPNLDIHGPFIGDGSYRLKPSFIPIILQLHERDQSAH